eukprot:1195246-Prorocentrum_minimum.AAC.3
MIVCRKRCNVGWGNRRVHPERRCRTELLRAERRTLSSVDSGEGSVRLPQGSRTDTRGREQSVVVAQEQCHSRKNPLARGSVAGQRGSKCISPPPIAGSIHRALVLLGTMVGHTWEDQLDSNTENRVGSAGVPRCIRATICTVYNRDVQSK